MARFWSIKGQVPYAYAHQLMLELADARRRELIPDTVLFLEHAPVITKGRGLQHSGGSEIKAVRAMPLPSAEILKNSGIDFVEVERGGDLTYHGPGQLVIYPILKLDGRGVAPRHDLGSTVRMLEQWVIDELSWWGVAGSRKPGASGVWVGERKVASTGIAVKRWISFHGIALNVTNSMEPFKLISPCGFSSDVMARVVDLAAEGKIPHNWRTRMEERLARAISPGQHQVRIRSFEPNFEEAPQVGLRTGLLESAEEKLARAGLSEV